MKDNDVLSLEILKKIEACALEVTIRHDFIYVSDISTRNTMRQFHVHELYKLYYFIDGAYAITKRNEHWNESEQEPKRKSFVLGERVQNAENLTSKGRVVRVPSEAELNEYTVLWDGGGAYRHTPNELCKVVKEPSPVYSEVPLA